MSAYQTELLRVTELEPLLPRLLSNLSLARAQIAIDQIRGAVARKALDQIVVVVATGDDDPQQPIAAAIALQHPQPDSKGSDTATVVHAGLLRDLGGESVTGVRQAIASRLSHELSRRGVAFAQWATDADADGTADDSVSRWCVGLGFEPLGTLDYLGGEVPQAGAAENTVPSDQQLRFLPVDWTRPDDVEGLTRLVDMTYTQTLDCPRLAEFRTAAQTLRGYQAAAAFDPSLWFFVHDADDSPVGCLLLGKHLAEDEQAAAVIEIVYMGLIAQVRGKQLGRRLVEGALDVARNCGATRLILAVDQQNHPARDIYHSFGLQLMLREMVWAKLLQE